jgi:hypothetical protein
MVGVIQNDEDLHVLKIARRNLPVDSPFASETVRRYIVTAQIKVFSRTNALGLSQELPQLVAMRLRIIWQLESIQQAASHRELCNARNRKCVGHVVAKKKTQSRFRYK